VIEQLVPTVEQHFLFLIRYFVGAASFVEFSDGALHVKPTLASCFDGFLG